MNRHFEVARGNKTIDVRDKVYTLKDCGRMADRHNMEYERGSCGVNAVHNCLYCMERFGLNAPCICVDGPTPVLRDSEEWEQAGKLAPIPTL